MSGFGLHAVGEFFDVDCYLSQHSIDYTSIWRKGENFYTNSGFAKYFGNEFQLNICEQEAIAIKYVRQNHDALKVLVGWKNVEAVVLGISPEIVVHPGVVSVCLSFSPMLVTLAGAIGLELAFYVRPFIDDLYDIPEAEDNR